MITTNKDKMSKVLEHFYKISSIPRGSGNQEKIADYCVEFAKEHSLRVLRDEANNVIIFKAATKGYENAEPIILQGHLDMVCQKTAEREIDFETEGIKILREGDFLKADGTTLGADNGIALSYVLAILSSDDIAHPEIQAVFTADEEIGMVGALQIDTDCITAKKMINIDSEQEDVITVSCAGGMEVVADIPISRTNYCGHKVEVLITGLLGGHSGVEINKGRYNANILAGRFLDYMRRHTAFELISINGGGKSNAITNECKIVVVSQEVFEFCGLANDYLEIIKAEIKGSEAGFTPTVTAGDKGQYSVIESDLKDKLIYMLSVAPSGVVQMSNEIENLVETSLNLGILKTEQERVFVDFSLRSNKKSAMDALQQKLESLFENIGCTIRTSGYYPAWEYKPNSFLQKLYSECFFEQMGVTPKVEAIHAGLECGVFCSKIEGLECIAIGPTLYDVHTVNEKMSISSAKRIYEVLLKVLEKCK